MAQHLDLLVNRGVFLDIRITLRYICLGLIVVVVRDEVDHGVVGKEFFELARELGGEGFVGAMTSVGLPRASMVLAMVKVLPEPVTPSKT